MLIEKSCEKRCGTCQFWDVITMLAGGKMGHCRFVLPKEITLACIRDEASRCLMYEDEGTTCPCWKAKEETNV